MRLSAPAQHRNRNPPPAAKVGELHAPQLSLWRAFFGGFPEKTSKNHRHFLTIPENICSLFIQLIE